MAILDVELAEKLEIARGDEVFDINIVLAPSPVANTEHMYADGDGVERVKSRVYASQESVLTFLDERKVSPIGDAGRKSVVEVTARFWGGNVIAARVSPDVVRAVNDRDDIVGIQLARTEPPDDPLVESFRPDNRRGKRTSGTIPWGLATIGAPVLWDLGIDGRGVVVAVIDSGVNYHHDDLKQRMWQSNDPDLPHHGVNFATGPRNDPIDNRGHGTLCAGVIAGDGTLGTRTGVAPGARIMALRAFGERQYWRAIEFAIEHRADVVNMATTLLSSWGPDVIAWRRYCELLLRFRICLAASAGNLRPNDPSYPVPDNVGTPANCPPPRLHPAMMVSGGVSSAVACGATDCHDRIVPLSSTGPVEWNIGPYIDYPHGSGRPGLMKPDLCAPGREITSCFWRYPHMPGIDPYFRSFSETSAATAHVAGAMALLVQATKHAGLKPDPARILQALEETARRVVGQQAEKENLYGAGRINVAGAYERGKTDKWW